MKIIEYSSNNSGGDWWLKKEDWLALEKAGWVVVTWEFEYTNEWWFKKDENWFPVFEKWWEKGINWLWAYATCAYRKWLTMEQAKEEFENITWQYPEEEWCPCCGQPHSFNEL